MAINSLLALSWDTASFIYHEELAPRFLPWSRSALSLAACYLSVPCTSSSIKVLVPCCGTMLEGREIISLFHGLGIKAPLFITGIDLSPQMVANQTSIADGEADVASRAVVGDASDLHRLGHKGSADLIFSSFGLQQLGARAPLVLSSWCECLKEGGLLVVVLWPSRAEEEGPWKAYQDAVDDLTSVAPSSCQMSKEGWEINLLNEALKLGGIEVLSDQIQQHEISWTGPDECWRVMTHGGPWTARRVRYGDEHMEDLKQRWENKLTMKGALGHNPCARIIAIRRNSHFYTRNKL